MKVCFFDIDGTLILTGGAGQRAFAATFRELFGVERLSPTVNFAGRSDRAIAYELFAAHGVPATDVNWRAFLDNYLARLPHVLASLDGQVLPGVASLIGRLQQLGDVHLGLLTGNVVRGAEAKLTHYGLWQHFAFGGFGDHHQSRNEIAAAALEAAHSHVGAIQPVEKVLVIGDTVHDIRCARSIGAHAVAVPTGNSPLAELVAERPDFAVETLEHADEIVQWLAA